MLTYNNHLKKLILPEYGRNIQNMVDHCVEIEDPEQRMACAETIINTMSTLFPTSGGDAAESRRKLWDHLMIMSDFKLDVPLPFELVRPEVFNTGPDKISPADSPSIRYRHYGLFVQQLIEKACDMEDGEEKDALVFLIANHMKKLMLAVNREGVEDAKIFKDLRMMSHGALYLDPETVKLHEFKQAPTPSGKKKKKK